MNVRAAGLLSIGAWIFLVSCGNTETGSPEDDLVTGGKTARGGAPSSSGTSGSTGDAGESGGTGGIGEGGANTSGGRRPVTDGNGEAGAPGEGGSAGQSVDAAQYAACAEYIVAQCERRASCGETLSEATCIAVGLPLCPDLLFSAGSRVSIDAVARCAQAYRDADCDDINRGSYPECEYEPGTIKEGSACAFSTQCETLACGAYSQNDCGVCLPVLEEGDECSSGKGICPNGTMCTGTCEPARPMNLPGGSACEVTFQCEGGFVCRASDEGGRTCQPFLDLGEPCAGSWECREGHCDAETKKCTPSAPVGARCSEDGWGYQRGCAGDAVCDELAQPRRCVERVGPGESCWLRVGDSNPRGNCQAGLDCVCLDATCGERECRFLRQVGQSCADPDTACVTGTVCRDGVCESTGSQGLFEAACSP